MSAHAEGTFSVKDWDEKPCQELDGGTKLTKATMTFGYGGGITGEGVHEAVMYYRSDGTAVYTGFQRVVGQVEGQDGSFILRADGTFADGEAVTQWQVVEGSGTGDLTGLTGSGRSAAGSGSTEGTFSLDYDLA